MDWFLREIRADVNPRVCVVGAVDSGKSRFFQHLATHQPHLASGVCYAYWRLTDDPLATAAAAFWAHVSGLLDLAEPLDEATMSQQLPALLAARHAGTSVRTALIVLDDWDYAQVHPDSFVHAESLRRLVRWVHSDQMLTQGSGPVRLGLCYITRFPSMQYLVHYARRRDTSTSTRLSQDLPERGFVAARFPFLDRTSAEALLDDAGCPPGARAAALEACGGWVGLLDAAASHARREGGWNVAVERTLRDNVLQVLSKSLLPEVMCQTGALSPEGAWDRVLRGLEAGEEPDTRYALPLSFLSGTTQTGAGRLPRAVRDVYAPPTFVVVDLENLCVRYERHAHKEPAAYPQGALAFCRVYLTAAIRHAADALNAPPSNVVIAAKSIERAQEVLGQLPEGWRVEAPNVRLERGHPSEADDKIAVGWIAQQAAANPAARFGLLTEDQENLGVLNALHVPRLVVWTPFESPRGVIRFASDTWVVRENLLPAVGAQRPPVAPSARGD